jgi:hypothetical protein
MPGHGREDGVVVRQDNKNLQLISERERERECPFLQEKCEQVQRGKKTSTRYYFDLI